LDDKLKANSIFNTPKNGQTNQPIREWLLFLLEQRGCNPVWIGLEPGDEKNGCVRYIQRFALTYAKAWKTGTLVFSQVFWIMVEKPIKN